MQPSSKRHAEASHAIEWEIVEEPVRGRSPPGRPKRDAESTYHADYWPSLTVATGKEVDVREERQRRSASRA